MEGKAKLRIHMILVTLKTRSSFTPKKLKRVTATEPLINQSKITKPGISDAIKYIENMILIPAK